MDVAKATGGSLQISTDVVVKIATMASLEIEGVKAVATAAGGVKGVFQKVSVTKPVVVVLAEDIAEITVSLIVAYGCKIPPLCVKVQENVKLAVQNMTGITVSKVNVIIAGVAQAAPQQAE